MKKAILFDFWGTLVEQGVYSPLKQTMKIMGVRMHFAEFVVLFERTFMTKEFSDLKEAFAEVGKAFGKKLNDHKVDDLIGVWNSNMMLAKPYEETEQVLANLKAEGKKLAIIANTHQKSIEQVLEKYDLAKYFDVIALSYKTGMLKTNVETFEKIISELGVTKEETLMVGDSIPTDIVGAKTAGVEAVLVDRKGKRSYADQINDLTELKERL